MRAELLQNLTLVLFILNIVFVFLLFFKRNFIRHLSLLIPFSTFALLAILWISYGRPPFKTLGETRLWYAAMLPAVCYIFSTQFRLKWLLQLSFGMSSLFLFINVMRPEFYDKTLAPALQSFWFIPHVVVYIVSYVLIAAAFLIAMKEFKSIFKKNEINLDNIFHMDDILRIGFFFLTAGLVFGAFWAKEAWGHYWTWDPKETWAFITWALFLFYFHFRHWYPAKRISAVLIILGSFIALLLCWFGLNYMAIGQSSVHTYSN